MAGLCMYILSSCVCTPPSGLTATSITANSANLGFTSTTGLWQIEYGSSGFTLGTGTSVFTTSNPHNVGSLTPSTAYSFYARSICGAGDTSTWAGPASFTTICGAAPTVVPTNAARCGPGTVMLSAASSSDATIRWYTTPSGGTSFHTGTSYTTPSLTSTTTYYVDGQNACGTGERVPITATVKAMPVNNLQSQDLCAGSTLTLDAGNSGSSYQWSNGATTQTISVATAGTYSVKVTTPGNCIDSFNATVTIIPTPVVDLGPDTAICPETAINLTLNAGNPGSAYLWDDGSTGQTRTVNAAGDYSVAVTAPNGCSKSDDIKVILKDAPSIDAINAVYGDGFYTFNAIGAQYVDEYTWNFGDGTPSVTGAIVQHTYAQNGIYTVTVQLGGQCEGLNNQYSVTVDAFGTTGVNNINLKSSELLLYPNPAKEQLIIENKSALIMKRFTVINVAGQMILTQPVDGNQKQQLNIGILAQGIYTLRIETDKGFVIRKFQVGK